MRERPYKLYADPLTIDQIVQGIEAAVENADQLLEDAKLLLGKERFARALSLAVLAEEETAKVMLLVGSITTARDPKGWIEFWKRFRSHNSKYMDILFLDSILIENGKELEKHFKSPRDFAYYIDLLKQMGFYTEFDPAKQRFLKPEEAIPKDFAEKVIVMATGRLGFVKRFHDKSFLMSYAKRLAAAVDELEQEDPKILENPLMYGEKLFAKFGINIKDRP